jgi:hypothetical protein
VVWVAKVVALLLSFAPAPFLTSFLTAVPPKFVLNPPYVSHVRLLVDRGVQLVAARVWGEMARVATLLMRGGKKSREAGQGVQGDGTWRDGGNGRVGRYGARA